MIFAIELIYINEKCRILHRKEIDERKAAYSLHRCRAGLDREIHSLKNIPDFCLRYFKALIIF